MSHGVAAVLIGALLVLSLYRRAQRTLGFQKLMPRRMRSRAASMGVIGCLLLVAGATRPIAFVYDALGAAAGLALAWAAVRTTQFQNREGDWYYRPHPWLGGVLLVVFVFRLAYRVYADYALMERGAEASMGSPAQQGAVGAYVQDPWTALILFALLTYHVGYALAVLRKHGQIQNHGEETSVSLSADGESNER